MRHLRHVVVIGLLTQACGEQAADAEPAAGAQMGEAALDAGAPTAKIDRSKLTNVGTSAPLDYSDPAMWACRPGNDPNECHANIDATEVLKDGSLKVVKHERAEDPEYDCFYVYPTVALGGGGNMTDFSDTGIKLVQDPLLSQAARFTRVCEVYAPLYRQVSLTTGDAGTVVDSASNPALAVGDVKAAFEYFIENLSKGRNFVLIGHSQGTSMLTELIRSTIDKDEALRKRMISAVLLGGQLNVEEGKRTGGSFENVPTCEKPGETGCVIAYVTYDEDAPPPPAIARFGRASKSADGRDLQVACTEPAPLADNPGRYLGSYFSTTSNNPSFRSEGGFPEGVTTRYVLYRDMFRGKCVNENGFSYLELSADKAPDDQRVVPPYRNARLETAGWGLHLVDFNPAIDDLIEAVSLSAAALKAKQ